VLSRDEYGHSTSLFGDIPFNPLGNLAMEPLSHVRKATKELRRPEYRPLAELSHLIVVEIALWTGFSHYFTVL